MRKMKEYKKMNEEKRILSIVKKRLSKDYGYPVSLIEENYVPSKGKKMADMIVFDSSRKDKPLIVVEIKSGDFVIPLGSAQLKQYMKLSNAKYGILTNGYEEIFFENVNELDNPVIIGKDFKVKQGFLEGSNVNAVASMVDMITKFRNYEASQKSMNAIDDTLKKAVNEVGRIQ